ncbi:methyltransferase domain-containing protein [Lichenicoccus roseus]|uniref:Methyltransferase domain-containing protein n=1 Tax=Lichenicoccus roseus TaxID=2683649 RepID=A0A5R9J8K4_9PROT|nr:methyltransferase domain-containing protein [Lichenicoccus roseus]TLU73935.1 methyltransferase domain-containing protein [Lichenicoccus roseus]
MQDPIIFDRRAVRLHRDRAAATVGSVHDILDEAAERLLDRLDDVNRSFGRALDIGGRGVVAARLRARGIETVSIDLSHSMVSRSDAMRVVADEEWLPFGPGSFDLVVASLSLHWVNDLPGALVQIRHAMRPDGLFLASMPVLPTLGVLRGALLEAEVDLCGGVSPRISPFPELRDCASLLQRAGFALPVADADTVMLAYREPLALLRDLRAAGETNAVALRRRTTPPRDLVPQALHRLGDRRPHQTVLRMAMMTGWSPSPDQPKPLKPGQFTVPLAEAIGDRSEALLRDGQPD